MSTSRRATTKVLRLKKDGMVRELACARAQMERREGGVGKVNITGTEGLLHICDAHAMAHVDSSNVRVPFLTVFVCPCVSVSLCLRGFPPVSFFPCLSDEISPLFQSVFLVDSIRSFDSSFGGPQLCPLDSASSNFSCVAL